MPKPNKERLIAAKQSVEELLNLLNLAIDDELSIADLSRKIGIVPQRTNEALSSGFRYYFKTKTEDFTKDDLGMLLNKIETPDNKMLKWIFAIEKDVMCNFPAYDAETLWNVVEKNVDADVFDMISMRLAYKYDRIHTLDEIGKKYGHDKNQIRMTMMRAVNKLRQPSIVNQIFNTDLLMKLTELDSLRVDLISKYDEAYNEYAKLNKYISSVDSVKDVNNYINKKHGELVDVIDNIDDVLNSEININIDTMNLSARTRNALTRAGYTTVNDICNLSALEIRNIWSLGVNSQLELIDALDQYAAHNTKWPKLKADLIAYFE